MEGRFAAEYASHDLNLGGYGGKWRQAVEDQLREGESPDGWAFWLGARRAFLEYGGGYKAGMAPPQGGG